MVEIESLSKFKRLYQNTWVAKDLKTGKVLAAAEKLKDVADKASKITEEYSVESVLPLNKVFMPLMG